MFEMNTGVSKYRFTVVSTRKQNLFLYYYLLVIVLFICITTVNLRLLTPVLRGLIPLLHLEPIQLY